MPHTTKPQTKPAKKTTYITVRCTQAERTRWNHLAQRAGVSLSRLLRDYLNSYQPQPHKPRRAATENQSDWRVRICDSIANNTRQFNERMHAQYGLSWNESKPPHKAEHFSVDMLNSSVSADQLMAVSDELNDLARWINASDTHDENDVRTRAGQQYKLLTSVMR